MLASSSADPPKLESRRESKLVFYNCNNFHNHYSFPPFVLQVHRPLMFPAKSVLGLVPVPENIRVSELLGWVN